MGAMALGEVANRYIQRFMADEEQKKIRRCMGKEEFDFAQSLFSDDSEVDLGEFFALELMRLGGIDTRTVTIIKSEFARLDKNGNGSISFDEFFGQDTKP